MTKFICHEFDTFDHWPLGYIAFADKASAKAWRRKHSSTWGVGISIYKSDASVPLHRYITERDVLYFTRLERER